MKTFTEVLVFNFSSHARKIVCLFFAFFLIAEASAQNQATKVTPTSAIYYYEYLPPDYTTNSSNYPVVIFLHGLGERGNDATSLATVARNGPPKHVKNGYKFPFILISPQLHSNYTDWPPFYIDEVIEYVKTTLRIDASRIYLTGLSLGGGGTWWYVQDPLLIKKIAAIAVMCGSRNTPSKACTLANQNLPVWAFHGDADGTVNFNKTVNMVNAINACIPTPNPLAHKTIYPGVSHNCWDRAYDLTNNGDVLNGFTNVYDWLMSYRNTGVTASTGPDINLNLPTNSTNIAGTGSTKTGSIISYAWTKVSGPASTITNASSPTVSLSGLVAGIYTFRLTVTNSSGDTAFDDVKLTVLSTNQSPVANAGVDISITLPTNALNLNGTGSDTDGSIATYSWTKISGPTATITNGTSSTVSLSALLQGTYVFSLTVTDNLGATGSDQVTITVNPAAVNQLPTANAGADKLINLPTNSTTLPGSGSDPDGSIATYLWEKVSGPTVTLTNAGTATASIASLVAGVYTFKLTVKDNQGATAIDQVTVTVVAANQSPTANAGADIILNLPTNVSNISGSGSDPDGTVASYEWTFVSGPNAAVFSNATTTTVTVSSLIQGTYIIRLTVTDDKGSTGFDDVSVTVNPAPVNVAPLANAGADQNITLPLNTVTLNGSGSDSDGSISSYVWQLLSGPTATLSNLNSATLTASNLVAGTYTFKITVTDNQSAIGSDNVTITVQLATVNQAPVVNAGADATLTLPTNTINLSGSATDADGTIASYNWTQISGPTGTLAGQTTPTLQLTNLLAGTYVFQLTVTDDKGATNSDNVTVSVNNLNTKPTANAGIDITLNLPTNMTDITGSGADVDGTISSHVWTQVNGPNLATVLNDNTSVISISNLIAGTYTFSLTVQDNDGAIGSDDVKVIVNAANLTPTANGGPNKTITLPTNSANFTGSGTDTDGTIVSYLWTQINGPGIATLTNSATQTLTVAVPLSGLYTFRFVVTDNNGSSDFDDVNLTVNPAAINQPPTASAGPNKSLTLPVNSLNITGSGSDPDGSIASYLWTKLSGPTVTIINSSSSTVSLNNLLEGTYTFRLTVTDNLGLTAFADVIVSVSAPSVNQSPVANAGPDKSITLPTNSITILGSGSDADGTVTTYTWLQLNGPLAVLSNTSTSSLSLSSLTAGVYNFRLTVTDDKGASGTDDILVTVNAVAVNQLPIANAGADKTISLPTNSLNLFGSASDADGSITLYNWLKVSGPNVTLGAIDQPTLGLSNLVEGTYIFRLEVTDNSNSKNSDDVSVTVLPLATNQIPIVSAGSDQTITLPVNTILLLGTASDAEGSITFRWSQVAGTTVTLINETTASLTINGLADGIYTFRLTVTDNQSATASDEVIVTVNAIGVNQIPVAIAGTDMSVKLPTNFITLTGAGTDPDGTIAGFSWLKISGPSIIMPPTNISSLALTNLVEGIYEFELIVTDNSGATDADNIIVTVLPASINVPPKANAGSDIVIQLPVNSTTITGGATDDGVNPLIYSWTKLSGPFATITGDATNTLSLTNLLEGVYVFDLNVTDDGALSDFDNVTVTVIPEPIAPAPPTVDVGSDIILQLPNDDLLITAVADSPNGLIQSYQWTQVLGQTVAIEPDTTEILVINNLAPGNYTFNVLVVDGNGISANDEVSITVLEADPTSKPINLFSPDGNGTNETWVIENSLLLDGCEITVYNRQGQKVYSSIGYSTQWNGTYNGNALPDGAYFYVIRCSGQPSQTGSVTIARLK